MTAPTPNAELAWRVMDHIEAHPEQHDQGEWIATAECGTIACFAGWTCLLSGDNPAWSPYENPDDEAATNCVTVIEAGIPHDRSVAARAIELLGLSKSDAGTLFYADGRARLGRMVVEIFGPRPDGIRLGEEMPPPPCADHAASELNCPVCTAQRRAFYAALSREYEVAEIVDHGPVKPPYGTPEREAYDREHGGAS